MSVLGAQGIFFLILFFVFADFNGSAQAQHTFVLQPSGEARALPENMMGFNAATAFYEDLIEDSSKIELTKILCPTVLRFPGGSIANYYQWETGMIKIPVKENSSAYTRMMSRVAFYTRRRHPAGIFIEKMTLFSRNVGAEVLLVPNLETSSIARQVAWFKSMKAQGIVPRYIELGNEFWVAMLNDPNVIEKFPNVNSAMKTMKAYLAGVQPYLPEEARIAVQGAASDFYTLRPSGGPHSLIRRMFDWDRGLENAPWFDAITIHLYPRPEFVMARGAVSKLPENVDRVFPAAMARVDAGLDRMVEAIKRRNPGKEIWITEWNPNHIRFSLENRDPGLTGMMIHLTARMFLAFLRHPEITVSNFHMLSFNGQVHSVFSPEGGKYAMTGPGVVIKWFHQAARGPALYQKIRILGANRIPGRGLIREESYLDFEAGLFEREDRFTLISQNAGRTPVRIDLASLLDGEKVQEIEFFTTPDLMKNHLRSPEIKKITPSSVFQAPALSLIRVIW